MLLKHLRMLIVAAVFVGVAPLAFADSETEASLAPDPTRPAVGEWIGGVSWNDPIVNYAWAIYSDGTFGSGRVGRGESGGGAWHMSGDHLTLKYADGFRYEGELHDNAYGGTAYQANGRAFGGFSMSRWMKREDEVIEAP